MSVFDLNRVKCPIMTYFVTYMPCKERDDVSLWGWHDQGMLHLHHNLKLMYKPGMAMITENGDGTNADAMHALVFPSMCMI